MTVLAPERQDGVTVVMPAYGEEENLASTVEDFLDTLELAGEAHTVVVVEDGSPDRTGEVADALAAKYPGRVIVVHHPQNRGYGAAVRTGIAAALEHTDSKRIFLTDSDGQFKAAQLPDFLQAARSERAEVVIGYRGKRADPLRRRINAFLWTILSMLLVRHGSRDVDCAYKLVDRRMLSRLVLHGEAATISPELLTKLRLNGARIIERPVDHFPRLHGEQTGADLRVILKSLRGLLALYVETFPKRPLGRFVRKVSRPNDVTLAVITLAAIVTSVVSFVYFQHRGAVLDYPDTYSHMMISRRVLYASTSGPAQLGGVWLPLPHLLIMLTVWINAWYYSGLSGSLVSMAAYVMTARFLYKTGFHLTVSRSSGTRHADMMRVHRIGGRTGGVVAALVFMTNPGVLYIQSTPMTETLLFACLAAGTYYLLRWCQNGGYRYLAACACASLLATLARYEGWVFVAAASVVVLYVTARRSTGLREAIRHCEANLLFYGFVGVSGIVGWVAWNEVIFHDPLNFQAGAYAKPSLWVPRTEPAIGSLTTSAKIYWYAIVGDFGLPIVLLGAVGLALFLWRTRLRPETVAPFALLVFVPFFIYALYTGQRPMHVMQVNHNLYNVRFALLIVLPLAFFIGYLASRLPAVAIEAARRGSWSDAVGWIARRTAQSALPLAVILCSIGVAVTGVSTLQEAEAFHASTAEQANRTAADWLRTHYDGGLVLMESFGNETVTFGSHIPVGSIIYEGSYKQWAPALADPRSHQIRWIYIRRTAGNPDDVARLLGSPALADYRPVYADADRIIYLSSGATQ